MSKVDVKELLEAGVHFGHRTEKWNPKMKPYIFEARNGIYVINLIKTVEQIETAAKFLSDVTSKGGKVLFVGCKKQSQALIKDFAVECGAFYITERWLGGTLTNLKTIRNSVARMEAIEAMETSGKIKEYSKQEAAALRRELFRIKRNLEGVRQMEKLPDVLIIVDVERENIAVKEAQRLGIPVVAITDTNADPGLVQFPIAGNDDAIRSIKVIIQHLVNAIKDGQALAAKKGTGRSKGAEAPAPANA